MSASQGDIADLLANGRIRLESGWALTQPLIELFTQELETDDQEVHEDELCQLASEASGIALVALAPGALVESTSGHLSEPIEIGLKQVQAVFVSDADGQLSWFGPTELESAIAYAN